MKPTLRSSSLPLFMVCSNAILNPDKLQAVETENEPALVGTLVHNEAQRMVDTGAYDLAGIKQRVNDADYTRSQMLFNNFLDVWREAKDFMHNPVTEWGFSVELANLVLTGHIDVHALEATRAFVLDYKTGRQHEDHYHQMAAYAYGVWDKAGRPDGFTVYVTSVYLEDKTVTPYIFTTDQLREWAKTVEQQVSMQRYTAGRKCAFCPLQGSCPAYRTFTTGALAVLNDDVAVAWEEMTEEERGGLIDRMYVIEKAIDRIKLSLRNLVRGRGAVDIGGGKEYVLVEQVEKQVDPEKALPILLESIGQGGFIRSAKLSLDAVLTAHASRAGKGLKMKARKELFEKLDKAGAIVRVKTTKMWRRPKGESVMEEGQ